MIFLRRIRRDESHTKILYYPRLKKARGKEKFMEVKNLIS
jgi:hypothetical protein